MSDKADKGASKRKRRRGGLRVPSDNVPRTKPRTDVSAPAPEDPHLAVSVAYAFSASAQPTEAEADAASDAPFDARDTIRNDKTPPPDPVPDDLADEASDIEEIEELEALEEIVSGEIPVALPAGGDSRRHKRLDATVEVNVEDDGRNLTHDTLPSPVQVQVEVEDEPVVEGSVDIAFDDDDDELLDETTPVADAIEPDAGDTAPAAPAAPSEASDESTSARFLRAKTVALTDQDLEELMEGEPEDQVTLSFDERKTLRIDPVAFRSRIRSGESGVDGAVFDDSPTVADAASETDDAVEDADGGGGVVVAPRGASDSGEIIADDMLEEIEDNAVAKPVALTPDPEPPAETEPAPTEESEASSERKDTEPPPMPRRKRTKTGPQPPPAPSIPPAVKMSAKAPPPEAVRRRAKGKPWFEEIFDENYLRTLPFLTPQATEAEANFVVDSLGVDQGAQLLDVGCGYGRHSMELAARGFQVVGLDLSLPLLLRGADEAQRRGLNINFVHTDMREMQFESQFDGAYCLFATFGYFDDETNKQAATNIARALKPGARLVLEVLNRDYLIKDLPTRVWWEGDGCVILEEVDFNYFSSRVVSTRSIAFEDGRQLEQEISIRAFALHELGKLLHAAGFRVVEVSGSMATRGRFFGSHSRDILVLAEKRATSNGDGRG